MFNKILINKQNLINNIKQVKLKNPNSLICAMVKANAYGIGDEIVASILNDYVDYFGVACFFEAKKIASSTNKNILIVGPLDYKNIDARFIYSCHCVEDVKFLANLSLKIKIHLKVNTGMNRFGFSSLKEFGKALKIIKHSNLILDGVLTHFATCDSFVKTQFETFCKFRKLCLKQGFKPIFHSDNSAVNNWYNHNLDMVRIGYNLFCNNILGFKPVVELESKIVQINKVKTGALIGYNRVCVAKQPMKVAVIPLGYADGFSTKYIGLMLNINNKQCKVLNVCMDCFMLDVSSCTLKKGCNIKIINNYNPLKLFADYACFNEYEVMCNFLNARADRLISASSCCENEKHNTQKR